MKLWNPCSRRNSAGSSTLVLGAPARTGTGRAARHRGRPPGSGPRCGSVRCRRPAGGPHATVFPEETARLAGVDYALAGEAEHSFVRLLSSLGDARALAAMRGEEEEDFAARVTRNAREFYRLGTLGR